MKDFEKFLIMHCAPTLASLKPASLFNYTYLSEEELSENIQYWNEEMNEKGLYLTILRKRNQKALIYVCRVPDLERVLKDFQILHFLNGYGYECGNCHEAIEILKSRLESQEDFPHEIGVFLGYPLEDVTGFIRNTGQNFVYMGFWKVYGNKEEAVKTFHRYKKCTDIYSRLLEQGRSVKKLIVAA